MPISQSFLCVGILKRLCKLFNLRTNFLLGGLCLTGYGLYLFSPWISFTVCGALLMLGGYYMRPTE